MKHFTKYMNDVWRTTETVQANTSGPANSAPMVSGSVSINPSLLRNALSTSIKLSLEPSTTTIRTTCPLLASPLTFLITMIDPKSGEKVTVGTLTEVL